MALELAIKEVARELQEALNLRMYDQALDLTRELEGLLSISVYKDDSIPHSYYECE